MAFYSLPEIKFHCFVGLSYTNCIMLNFGYLQHSTFNIQHKMQQSRACRFVKFNF